jgi:TolB-like protein/DNA-binding winged helix-turn-helix (wHTH) protein
MSQATSYRFDQFILDCRSASLRRDGVVLPLRPKSFDVLLYFVQNPGRLIPKTELIDSVWHKAAVTENSLVQCIKEVRLALCDEQQTTIKTVPKRGYLFSPEVVDLRQGGTADGRNGIKIAAGFVLDEVLGPGSAVSHATRHLPLPDRPSIAVLPFTNMDGDPDQEYLADGISEDLITGLARIHWLFVIARNSTFVYKHRAVDVTQVARRLGVRYVLEGSVRRAGQQLRISAQLIAAVSGGHLWAERYDRQSGDIFAVQDEITRSVAAAIEPHLLAAEGARALSHSSNDLGAWELVAQAQVHFWRLSRSDYATATDILTRAVEAHPEYAPARSMLGFCLIFALHMGWVDRDQGLLAGQHAIRGSVLDDRDPWGQIAIGYLALMEKRTVEAIAAFRRAVDLNPSSAYGHYHLGHGLAFAGQDREAIARAEDAIRLSPLDPMTALFLGAIAVAHYVSGRYEEAEQYTTEAARLRPGFQGAQRLRCASLAQAGRLDEARSLLAALRLEQPRLSLSWIRASVPYQTPELMERFLEGMRKAGLTEE